ncbi:MAG TPA: M56 family metallopeptidase, partial [Steroidobacteraceae bacterium]|nr:M56 family metallopeptidase [Steroidobacteraceae bacterium]
VGSPPSLLGVAIDAAAPVVSPALVLGTAPVSAPPSSPRWLLSLAWCAGTLVLAVRWWRGWRAADSLSRAAQPAPGASADVRITNAHIEPSVARVFRPLVLLPAALPGRLTAPQLAAVLAHERAHIARRDNLTAHLQRLVEALFWFHPLVWFIGVRLREERERACDEAVLERGHDAADYASGILEVCRHCATAHAPDAVAALAGNLTLRVRHILASTPPLSLGFLKAAVLTACTLAVALLPLIAGAMDDAARRRVLLNQHVHVLQDAVIYVRPLAQDEGGAPRLDVDGHELAIRNSSLRELVALAYGVDADKVTGGGNWLDQPRYEFRAVVGQQLSDPEDFQPAALRGLVNKLLGSRFDLEIHVNQQCQAPCGRDAQARVPATR